MHFKKQICLLLAFFLLLSNSGLAFNVHFCEGKIASISSVFSDEEVCEQPVKVQKTCCVKLEVSHKKCCSDKKVDLKNKTEKIVFKTLSSELDSALFTEFWTIKINAPITVAPTVEHLDYYCDANAPPLYRLYCQFTLFG